MARRRWKSVDEYTDYVMRRRGHVTWKKGKTFSKNGRRVRYIYPNGKKRGKKLVSAKRKRSYRRY